MTEGFLVHLDADRLGRYERRAVEETLQNLHRKLKGSLMQIEAMMTALDIPYKPIDTAPN